MTNRTYRKSRRPWRKFNPSYWFKRTVRDVMARIEYQKHQWDAGALDE